MIPLSFDLWATKLIELCNSGVHQNW